jgi:folate-binding protein YgfZ
MANEIVRLDDRAVLSVSGEDAAAFLQGLLTADVAGLSDGEARPSALLTPQGKILFLVLAIRDGGRFLIDCPASQADDLLKRLSFYKLRSKVAVGREHDLAIAVAPAGVSITGATGFADPRLARLGLRFIARRDALAAAAPGGAASYRARRIAAGIAEGDEIAAAGLFPHEANLDLTGGVSFTKGCYVGQEVVSRMEHRATARSRLMRAAGAAVAPGAAIVAGERSIGEVIAAEGKAGVALVRLDRLAAARAEGIAVTCGGEPVEIAPPDGVSLASSALPDGAANP